MNPAEASLPDLTWASLLAHWTEFARSALALPKEGEGGRLRTAVPDIIGLQAVTFALGDLERLPAEERPVALDRAALLIRRHAGVLHEIWRGEPMPGELITLIEDARRALDAAKGAGIEWRLTRGRMVAEHPAGLIAALVEGGFAGDLYLPVGNETLFAGEPVAFVRGPHGAAPGDDVIDAVTGFFDAPTERSRLPAPRQVYRQYDFATGRATRDVVMPFDGGLPAGQPLLAPAILAGAPQAVPLLPRPRTDLPDLPVLVEPDLA